jgi:hypothetical protein
VCGEPPVEVPPEAKPWSRAGKIWLAWWLFWGSFTVGSALMLLSEAHEAFLFVLLGCGVAGFLALIFWATWLSERKRMLAMTETCKLMEFTFVEKVSKEQLAAFGRTPLFKLGHSHKAYNLMQGGVGDIDLLLLDYRYIVGHGKHQQTHNQTLVLLPTGATHLPNFQLFPEGFFHKLAKLFGKEHIKFPENKAFSDQYQLRGPNEMAIRRVFTPEVLAHFAQNAGWSVEAHDGWFVVFVSGKRCKPEGCPERIAEALRIHGLFAVNEGTSDAA